MRRWLIIGCLTAIVVVAGAWRLAGDDGTEAGIEVPPLVGDRSVECDRVLVPGADVEAFFDRLEAGETICLREGGHEAAEAAVIDVPGVLLTSYPGESATLTGRLWIKEGADGVVVQDLALNGRSADARPSPTINADEVVFRRNDVTNDHTGICFVIGDETYGEADGTLIEGNRIHDCGRLPPTNHDHGIYVANARDTVIRGNAIFDNADRGVQLYPDADDSLITGNVIDGNGQGVIFGGNGEASSDRNTVVGNVITSSTVRFNLESSWPGPVGSGNVARGNCVWTSSADYPGDPAGSGIQAPMEGVEVADNVVVSSAPEEQSEDRSSDASSTCAMAATAP